MTFEEFFIKKKIDLALVQRAEPDLYEEFRVHYAQMGAKSFDHTKKYLFNRLRKSFLLATAEIRVAKPVASTAVVVAAKEPTAPASEASKPTELSSTGPSGFKPRFKAAAMKAAPDAETSSERPPEEPPGGKPPAAKPTGFKPRFKAGSTTNKKDDTT